MSIVENLINAIRTFLVSLSKAKGLFAFIGVIFILFATTVSGITFVFDNVNQETSYDLMWNGDLVNSESGSTAIPYKEAQETWLPFLTGPLTPNLIIYLGTILALIGIIARSVSIRIEQPVLESRARYSIQAAFVLFWVALGLLTVYFLGIQSSSKGISLFESIGSVLVIFGSLTLIPVSSPYDFDSVKGK